MYLAGFLYQDFLGRNKPSVQIAPKSQAFLSNLENSVEGPQIVAVSKPPTKARSSDAIVDVLIPNYFMEPDSIGKICIVKSF
jgi:hypothetical protein